MVESTKRKLVSFAVTVSIVLSLLALAQPTTAALVTVTGPREVSRPDTFTVSTTVTIRSEERVGVDRFRLTLSPDGDDAEVTVVFDADGEILAVSPARGVVSRGGIRVSPLRRSLSITPQHPDGSVGYGYGYGYGYGSGDRQFAFDVQLDSKAFEDGRYVISVAVDGDADVVTAGQTTVSVVSPSTNRVSPTPPDGRPDRLPIEVPNDVKAALHRLIRLLVPYLQSGSAFPRGG